MRRLLYLLCLIACGRESDPTIPAQYKRITINTMADIQVRQLSDRPYCDRNCGVLEVQHVGKFYCLKVSTQYQPLISEVICEL